MDQRRVYLDTRFELDVETDADGDGGAMALIDGGMHGTLNPSYAWELQEASWASLIDRGAYNYNAHYFDFLVDVPDGAEEDYFGYLSYEDYQLHIYGDRYEIWTMSGTATHIDTYYASTGGRHNIGIRAGVDAGVWVDGSQILGGPTTTLPRPLVRFGTHKLDGTGDQPGLVLLENLCYVRSWLRLAGWPAARLVQPDDVTGSFELLVRSVRLTSYRHTSWPLA